MPTRFLVTSLSFILALLIATPSGLAASDPLGHFSVVAGTVSVQRSKTVKWLPAQVDMPVYFGDTVSAGPDGQGKILFSDESLLQISPNSRVAINTIISPVEKKNSVLLFFGRVWSKVSRTAFKRKTFEVQTPTAV